jgi:HSP20 family protein
MVVDHRKSTSGEIPEVIHSNQRRSTMFAYPVATRLHTAPSLARLMDGLLEEAGSVPVANAAPRCDVYTDKSTYFVDIELPGVKKHNVHVKVEGGVLHVSAERTESETKHLFLRRERPVGKVEQSFRLGENLDLDKLEATFEDGILRLSVPLKASAVGREISVK